MTAVVRQVSASQGIAFAARQTFSDVQTRSASVGRTISLQASQSANPFSPSTAAVPQGVVAAPRQLAPARRSSLGSSPPAAGPARQRFAPGPDAGGYLSQSAGAGQAAFVAPTEGYARGEHNSLRRTSSAGSLLQRTQGGLSQRAQSSAAPAHPPTVRTAPGLFLRGDHTLAKPIVSPRSSVAQGSFTVGPSRQSSPRPSVATVAEAAPDLVWRSSTDAISPVEHSERTRSPSPTRHVVDADDDIEYSGTSGGIAGGEANSQTNVGSHWSDQFIHTSNFSELVLRADTSGSAWSPRRSGLGRAHLLYQDATARRQRLQDAREEAEVAKRNNLEECKREALLQQRERQRFYRLRDKRTHEEREEELLKRREERSKSAAALHKKEEAEKYRECTFKPKIYTKPETIRAERAASVEGASPEDRGHCRAESPRGLQHLALRKICAQQQALIRKFAEIDVKTERVHAELSTAPTSQSEALFRDADVQLYKLNLEIVHSLERLDMQALDLPQAQMDLLLSMGYRLGLGERGRRGHSISYGSSPKQATTVETPRNNLREKNSGSGRISAGVPVAL